MLVKGSVYFLNNYVRLLAKMRQPMTWQITYYFLKKQNVPSLLFIMAVTNLKIWTLLGQSHSEPYFTEQMWQFMASQIIWDPDVAPSFQKLLEAYKVE